jgi:folylpolyglutamate synthase/dihydropteroate synthase
VENPRAKKATALFEIAQQVLHECAANSGTSDDEAIRNPELHCEVDKRAAWNRVNKAADDADVICIAGSFFIAAEMKRLLAES